MGNEGFASAVVTNVDVIDTLPAGMVFGSAAGAGWSCGEAAGVVTCSRPSLAVGAAPQITISVTSPSSGGLYTNTATVASDAPDPVAANDSATAVTTATVGLVGDCNGDDKLDAADLVAILRNVGLSNPLCDVNGDSVIDQDDVRALVNNLVPVTPR